MLLVCQCNGDRTCRHNRLRNVVFEDAKRAALTPEREKAGLLLARPPSDDLSVGAQPTNQDRRARRRPADIYLPRGLRGTREALDFACTSGMRADTLWTAGQSPGTILSNYEQSKRDFVAPGETLTTSILCSQQGLTFTPACFRSSRRWMVEGRQCSSGIYCETCVGGDRCRP